MLEGGITFSMRLIILCCGLAAQAYASSSSGNSTDTASHASHAPHDTAYYSILFPFFALALGFLTNSILARAAPDFPYTVMMMIWGIAIGVLHKGTDKGLGVLSDSVDSWDNIDPHLLMYSFIPALLFGDSMGLNYYNVQRCFWQCLLLAGPGVVIGTGLTALVAKYVLPYGWDWNMALCFGSITAATDPGN